MKRMFSADAEQKNENMIITGLDPSLTPSLILLHKALIFFLVYKNMSSVSCLVAAKLASSTEGCSAGVFNLL